AGAFPIRSPHEAAGGGPPQRGVPKPDPPPPEVRPQTRRRPLGNQNLRRDGGAYPPLLQQPRNRRVPGALEEYFQGVNRLRPSKNFLKKRLYRLFVSRSVPSWETKELSRRLT